MKVSNSFFLNIFQYFKRFYFLLLIRLIFFFIIKNIIYLYNILIGKLKPINSTNKLLLNNNINNKINELLTSNNFNFFDYTYIYIVNFFNKIKLKYTNKFEINYRLNQTSWSFYSDIKNYNTKKTYSIKYLFSGFSFLWQILRFWVIGLFLFIFLSYYLLYIRTLSINKIIFEWILIVMFLYWLLSGFVFFIKKYQYSKFTSVIQRFWKRSYILFWLIETGIFLVFFYLTINASDEPFYMYDQMKVYKTQLFSWRFFILKIVPVIFLILIGYYLQLSLKWNLFNKQSLLILSMTLLLIYIVWLEFYQFFHIISFYGNLVWVYDLDDFLWNLEIESRRTRLLNNYIAICLMAKFWHLIFIFVFWVFFILRISEIGRIRYPLLVANLQNFIILYIMSWLFMLPWLKFTFRRHMNSPYYWFFLNFRFIGVRVFFYDIKLFFYSIIDNIFRFNSNNFFNYSFFYWSFREHSSNTFKNNFMKDYFIDLLNS